MVREADIRPQAPFLHFCFPWCWGLDPTDPLIGPIGVLWVLEGSRIDVGSTTAPHEQVHVPICVLYPALQGGFHMERDSGDQDKPGDLGGGVFTAKALEASDVTPIIP